MSVDRVSAPAEEACKTCESEGAECKGGCADCKSDPSGLAVNKTDGSADQPAQDVAVSDSEETGTESEPKVDAASADAPTAESGDTEEVDTEEVESEEVETETGSENR